MTVLLGAWGRVAGAAVVVLAGASAGVVDPGTAAAASTGPGSGSASRPSRSARSGSATLPTDALYYNVCGWANPSGDIPGSTPFYIVSGPRDTLPGAGGYEAAAARTAAQTPQLATDLAYYAVHGALPTGVTTLPAAAGPQYTCAGSAS